MTVAKLGFDSPPQTPPHVPFTHTRTDPALLRLAKASWTSPWLQGAIQ